MRRTVLSIVGAFAILFVGAEVIWPVATSYWMAAKAPPEANIVPTELNDKSVSQATGAKLSYLGYEFEVPWSDLDDSLTRLHPQDKPDKTSVLLRFRSGLAMMVSITPAHYWSTDLAKAARVPRSSIEAMYGANDDYSFWNNIYEITPAAIHHWSFSRRVQMQESMLLLMKSVFLTPSAHSGIFRVENDHFKGFEEGDPKARPGAILIHFFSDDGDVEIVVSQGCCRESRAVTQPELNRIIKSLRKAYTVQ